MTQVTQYDKNGSAEGAAPRVSYSSATAVIATDTFTGWPISGSKSHKLTATSATVDAFIGLPLADRPAAAAGQVWSSRATVRNSSVGSRVVRVQITFYDAVGGTAGSQLSSTYNEVTVAPGAVAIISVDGAIAPASTQSVSVLIGRMYTVGFAAVGDVVHADVCTLTRTATAMSYRNPASSLFATWTGTAEASTQVYWDPSLTATPATDETPAPRVVVLVDDLPPTIGSLTLLRTADGRTFKVRGAVNAPVSTGFQTQDLEAPFQVQSDYRAQMFTTGGADAGYTVTASATLDVDECWVHNPVDPAGATAIDVADKSGKALTRPISGERFYPEQRSLAVFVTGRRLGLQGVDLYFSTADAAVAAKFESMFGGYDDDDQLPPVLCVRTPPLIDIPRVFFAGTLSPTLKPITVHMGGNLREWEGQFDEASPPFAGIIVALLKRDDIDAFFSTRNALDAAYATRLAIDRDYAKAGTT